MYTYKIVEIFESINGEGTKAGQLALFIRFQKCNLSCSYCDTTWANGEDAPYTLMTISEIYNRVIESGINNITITGGEPLLQENIDKLLIKLSKISNINIEIETNGSILLEKFFNIPKVTFTMDYKLPSSNMENSMCTENFKFLKSKDTVKFVVGNIKDLEKAQEIINSYSLTKKCFIYLSPVYNKINPQEIVEFMKKHRLNDINMQLQIHKIIWSPEARGV